MFNLSATVKVRLVNAFIEVFNQLSFCNSNLFFIFFFLFFFFLLKCFILQNKTHNRDKTKDSTYNITDTKEKKKFKLNSN